MDTSPKKARILGHSETGGYESTIYIDSTTGWLRSLVAPPQGGAGGLREAHETIVSERSVGSLELFGDLYLLIETILGGLPPKGGV